MKKIFVAILFLNVYCFPSESDLDREISEFVLVDFDSSSKINFREDKFTQDFNKASHSPINEQNFHEDCLKQACKKTAVFFSSIGSYFTVGSQKNQ